jgi:FkbM family methyltransferase
MSEAIHHPIFEQYQRNQPKFDGDFEINFMGARIRNTFEARIDEKRFFSGRCGLENKDDPTLPSVDGEDYMEWIDLLEAIRDAKGGRFVMIEAGAGYGRWLVNAVAAIRRYKSSSIKDIQLVGIEADPARYAFLLQHLEDNDISPAAHQMIRAAVTSVDHGVFFDQTLMNSTWKYGQQVLRNEEWEKGAAEFEQANLTDASGKLVAVKVPGVRLQTILKNFKLVDLIDFDVQGEELAVIADSIEEVNARVKRMHIGTHGVEIEAGLRKILKEAGWECLNDYSIGNILETPYGGKVHFLDGIQSWRNPRLRDASH